MPERKETWNIWWSVWWACGLTSGNEDAKRTQSRPNYIDLHLENVAHSPSFDLILPVQQRKKKTVFTFSGTEQNRGHRRAGKAWSWRTTTLALGLPSVRNFFRTFREFSTTKCKIKIATIVVWGSLLWIISVMLSTHLIAKRTSGVKSICKVASTRTTQKWPCLPHFYVVLIHILTRFWALWSVCLCLKYDFVVTLDYFVSQIKVHLLPFNREHPGSVGTKIASQKYGILSTVDQFCQWQNAIFPNARATLVWSILCHILHVSFEIKEKKAWKEFRQGTGISALESKKSVLHSVSFLCWELRSHPHWTRREKRSKLG